MTANSYRNPLILPLALMHRKPTNQTLSQCNEKHLHERTLLVRHRKMATRPVCIFFSLSIIYLSVFFLSHMLFTTVKITSTLPIAVPSLYPLHFALYTILMTKHTSTSFKHKKYNSKRVATSFNDHRKSCFWVIFILE